MKALQVCDTVPALLTAARRLRVHSVFTNACNLQTPEQDLVTLQTRAMPLVPGGCILPCDDLGEWFHPGTWLAVGDGPSVGLAAVTVTITDAPRRSLRLNEALADTDRHRLHHALQTYLPMAPPAQGMFGILAGDGGSLPAETISKLRSALDALACWLRQSDAPLPLVQALEKLVGFGIGLTPAADDFLLGILLAADAVREVRCDELCAALRPLRMRSTVVGAAMLANGCAGRYAENLLALLAASPAGQLAALQAVASHGHSSGHDTLCGVEFALRHLARATPASGRVE
jgi:hypothetical protein